MSNWPLLSVLIWLPIIGGALILAIRDAQTARWASLGVAVLTFVASLSLLSGYNAGVDGLQFVETHAWIPAYKIGYNLGVDGIAVALILLTTLVSVLALIGAWSAIDKRVNQYVAALSWKASPWASCCDGRDAVLRVLRSDADPDVPDHRCLAPRRIYAALKFFLYTFLGSVLMLVALIYLYMKGGSFQLADLYALPLSAKERPGSSSPS